MEYPIPVPGTRQKLTKSSAKVSFIYGQVWRCILPLPIFLMRRTHSSTCNILVLQVSMIGCSQTLLGGPSTTRSPSTETALVVIQFLFLCHNVLLAANYCQICNSSPLLSSFSLCFLRLPYFLVGSMSRQVRSYRSRSRYRSPRRRDSRSSSYRLSRSIVLYRLLRSRSSYRASLSSGRGGLDDV